MNQQQLHELLLQSLEQEMGGIKVYEAALRCVMREDLREEWTKYLDETRGHERVLRDVCTALGVDADLETPGRAILRSLGQALVRAMEQALVQGPQEAAQLVACECVVLAETKDHADWELLGECARHSDGDVASTLKIAYEEVEGDEDQHLYHTKGWCRELWLESLGMPAVLPPPEERQQARTAIGAAKAQQSRERLL